MYSKYTKNLPFRLAPPYVTYPNVLGGYKVGGTYIRNLLSLFELHTETFNAWTMIIGACLSLRFLYLALTTLQPSFLGSLGFLTTTAGTVIHAPFSVGFHLFRGMDKDTYNLWRRLDQIFIFVAGVLFCFGMSYYVFSPIILCPLTLIALLVSFYACKEIWNLKPEFRRNRLHMFLFVGTIGACFTLPAVVQGLLDAFASNSSLGSMWASLQMSSCLVIGGLFYAAGAPEGLLPGAFDYFLSSHQIMHIFVVASHIFQYRFILLAYETHYQQIS